MAVTSPVLEVGRFAVEDITERSVTIVAGAAKHSEVAIQLAGEEYTIAVEGQEGILQLVEGLKVKGIGDTDRRTVVAITPSDIVAVFDEDDTRVVAIDPLTDLLVFAFEGQRLGIDIPVDRVIAEADVQTHTAVRIVAAEYPSIAFAEANNSAIEDAIGGRQQVAWDDGVGTVAPDDILTAFGTIFPRHVG
ncbi:hypothetical protein HMPREF3185_01930 [Porphyromonas somerae]|uniref:Uncharacterized protein n=1 Tax=Porphyromonas somerae TaxID=322095 RepID=A0A134B105_9PORP|nr:hypothetical protein HMPREF3184_01930 [Porphyromonadaceae bacterium KA00676]KXB73628.1 hypothetical protein HMPREF3185_01930 [Porphyromonas somerae]